MQNGRGRICDQPNLHDLVFSARRGCFDVVVVVAKPASSGCCSVKPASSSCCSVMSLMLALSYSRWAQSSLALAADTATPELRQSESERDRLLPACSEPPLHWHWLHELLQGHHEPLIGTTGERSKGTSLSTWFLSLYFSNSSFLSDYF